MPEIVKDGYNGLVLPTGNMERLVETLSNLDKYDWSRLGCNSRAFFEENLTFVRMRREYCDMLDSLHSQI